MRKWAKWNMVTTVDQFDEQEYIWVNGKVYHCGWFKSWQYRQVSDLIKSGRVYEVVRAKYPAGIIEKDGKLICSICAESVLSESKYCPHCGTRLKWTQTNIHDATDIQGVTEPSYLETTRKFFELRGIYPRQLDLSKEEDRNSSFVATLCPSMERVVIKNE